MDPRLPEGSVLLVSETLSPGANSVYAHSLMEGLTEANVPHPMLSPGITSANLLPAAELDNVQVVKGLFWNVWRPFNFRKLTAWAASQQPILIHGLSAHSTNLCARLADALHVPFLVTINHFQQRGHVRLEKGCYGFITVSDSLRENLVNDAHIPKEFVHLIPLGIRMREQLPSRRYDGSVLLVTSIGKLIPRKDFGTFLRAARQIVESSGCECSFVLAGDGPDEPALRKLAHALKLDKHLTFSQGATSYEQLLCDTDVYVQSSKEEGFGTRLLQAMACGAPVVATSTGGLIPLVQDGETGYLVPVGHAPELAERVIKLLQDRSLRARLGAAGRQAALENFSLARMMSATLDLYQEATAGVV